MKRVFLSVVGTVLGLVALLSFKSQSHATVGAKLPSAALGGGGASAAASPVPAPASGSTSASSKTFDGTAAQTRYGTVQVEVTVAGGKITDVSFLQLTSNDGRSADINSQAGPLLLQETLTAQSSNIDTISGATYTSEGYQQSLQSALDQAGLK
jgi:uncharacterized protein with FMN-binding domain